MKIRIKADGHNINLWLPNSLLKSRFVYGIIKSSVKRNAKNEEDNQIPLTHKQLVEMYNVIKQCVKVNGHFNLVDVESHDGEKVLIRI